MSLRQKFFSKSNKRNRMSGLFTSSALDTSTELPPASLQQQFAKNKSTSDTSPNSSTPSSLSSGQVSTFSAQQQQTPLNKSSIPSTSSLISNTTSSSDSNLLASAQQAPHSTVSGLSSSLSPRSLASRRYTMDGSLMQPFSAESETSLYSPTTILSVEDNVCTTTNNNNNHPCTSNHHHPHVNDPTNSTTTETTMKKAYPQQHLDESTRLLQQQFQRQSFSGTMTTSVEQLLLLSEEHVEPHTIRSSSEDLKKQTASLQQQDAAAVFDPHQPSMCNGGSREEKNASLLEQQQPSPSSQDSNNQTATNTLKNQPEQQPETEITTENTNMTKQRRSVSMAPAFGGGHSTSSSGTTTTATTTSDDMNNNSKFKGISSEDIRKQQQNTLSSGSTTTTPTSLAPSSHLDVSNSSTSNHDHSPISPITPSFSTTTTTTSSNSNTPNQSSGTLSHVPSSSSMVDPKDRFKGIGSNPSSSSKQSSNGKSSTPTNNKPSSTSTTASQQAPSLTTSASKSSMDRMRSSHDIGRDAKKKDSKKTLTMPSQSKNKIVVIGCRGIGKSEMVYKFLFNEIRYFHQLKKEKGRLMEELKSVSTPTSPTTSNTTTSTTTTTNDTSNISCTTTTDPPSSIPSSKQNGTTPVSSPPQQQQPPTPSVASSCTSDVSTPSSPPITTTQLNSTSTTTSTGIGATASTNDSLPKDASQIVESEIDISLKATDTLEVRRLKLLIMKKDQEIKKQKEEMENTIHELSNMWKKERTEKLDLEQEYVEKENELNHYISVVDQIHTLINLDPNSTDLPDPFGFKLSDNPNNSILSPNRRKMSSHQQPVANTLATPKTGISQQIPITTISSPTPRNNSNNEEFFDLQNFNPSNSVSLTPMSAQRKPRHLRTESTFQKLRTNQYQVVAQDFRKSVGAEEDADASDQETNSLAAATNEIENDNEDEINLFLNEFNRSEESNLIVTSQLPKLQPMTHVNKASNSNSEDSTGEEDTENDYSESSDIMSVSSNASSGPKTKVSDSKDSITQSGVTANSLIFPSAGKLKSPTIVQSTDYKYDENLFVKLLTPSFHLTEGLRRFNTGKPKDALKYLTENGILPDVEAGLTESGERPEAVISRFFAIADSLNKEKLGEFFGDPKNTVYLEEFVKFHIQELHSDEKKPGDDTYMSKFDRAIRSFFIQFKLPKEGQQVTRIAEAFSSVYSKYNKNDGEINGNEEACYLLVCSILMVNTQLHNPASNIKLTRDQFVSMFSLYKDVNQAFIGSCYDSIAKNAMVFYDEDIDAEDRTNFETDDQIDLFFKCYKPKSSSSSSSTLSTSQSEVQLHPHRALKSLSLDNEKVKQLMEGSITFYFKAKVIHDGVINRIQIKDSDPNLELATQEGINEAGMTVTKVKLKDPSQVNEEAKSGNYFICSYSVTDKTSFLIVEHIIKAIRKIKRKERKKETKKNKSSKSKSAYNTLTGSVTEELLQMLNDDDSDYNNDKFMVLVGCKADVPDEQRQVSKKEGGELALKYSIPFFEVSNHDMVGIRKVFLNAVDSLKRQNASYVDAVKQMNDFHKRMNIAKQNKKGQVDVNALAILPKCYI
ncbi:hypothetical protein C9374_002838 [Naegleria lovaniensis]|uniref:SEC7 domain-containing protein n=1 Tax=Naegleria lovaniensis TaxID=51637 RepID=A0AA88GPC5_NAELO|nr:uncharacterized protein C9374_002838 [Naegleria lovaniensis]KAG2386392.1 hypothetical protein C9374_002838 [Naegleria lovaniensis]